MKHCFGRLKFLYTREPLQHPYERRNTMAKLSVTLTVLASFLVAPPAMATKAVKATATLVDPFLADGDSRITADLLFVNDGSKLMVTGIAQGMDPTKQYFSLIYDEASASSGPTACTPVQPSVSPPPSSNGLTFDQMELDEWQPIGSRTRTLNAERRGVADVPLTWIGTVSVRRIDPTATPLMACGEIVIQKQ